MYVQFFFYNMIMIYIITRLKIAVSQSALLLKIISHLQIRQYLLIILFVFTFN